jgi:hypothetical protein
MVALPPRVATLAGWRATATVAAALLAAPALGWFSAARSPLLGGSAVIGSAFALWSLRRAEVALAGLVAVIAVLPFAVAPLRLAVAPTFLDLTTALVWFVWLARVAVRRSRSQLGAVGVWLALFAGVMLAAYVLASERLALDESARLFAKVVIAHVLFVPLLNLAGGASGVRLLASGLVAFAAVESLIGIALYVVPRGLALRLLMALGPLGYPTDEGVLRYRPETEILRATGTAVDPNMLGALLMVAAAIAVPGLLAKKPALPKPFLAASLVPVLVCLLLTESRGSWVGLAGGLLFVGALRYRRLWIAFGLMVALALVLPQAERFTGHLLSGFRAADRASAMRLGELENAREIISRHPWFGVGWQPEGQTIELAFTLGVSNVYLTIAERSGLIALAVYLAALISLATVLWPAIRARGRDPDDDGLLLGLVAALVAAQIAGMLDHHFVRFPHLVSLLWLTAALAVVVARDPAVRRHARPV